VCRQCLVQQEYQQLHYNLGHKITAIVATGNGLAYSTGRLSYTFGLQVCWLGNPAGKARPLHGNIWQSAVSRALLLCFEAHKSFVKRILSTGL
jgi:hypothetical protein